MEAAFDFMRAALGLAIALVGLVFIAGGVLGLLRFPDFYTRLHAARVADGVGAVLVCLGLALAANDGAVSLRLLLLALLVAAVGPLLAQLAANAAHAGGLAPLTGRFVAPRPGARQDGDGA